MHALKVLVPVTLAIMAAPSIAQACGCFAPPTVGEPVVQAGERIVFAHDGANVVAHIQIQFQGDAREFAWLVPMPSVPDLRLGSEELFTEIQAATNPRYTLIRTPGEDCGGSGFGCAASDFALAGASPRAAEEAAGVAVKAASAGPYDWAVVRADEKKPMLDWLQTNGFFVPAGTQAAIDPYIRPGAYFLALKLQSGQTAGDIQPVILEYASERPMVPIILTSVAAVDDMGVLVWVLGEHSAIPHNYGHVWINEEYLDWENGAANYADVVGKAIDEADDHHAFVTEFAGSTDRMLLVLDRPGRYGTQEGLAAQKERLSFVQTLRQREFDATSVQSILQRELAIRSADLNVQAPPFSGITADQLLWDVYTDAARQYFAEDFDSETVAAEIWERIVVPNREAAKLFTENKKMTRLLTILDPDEMTEDPVFAFNPDLADVSNEHSAEMVTHCDSNSTRELFLQDGRVYEFEQEEGRTITAREDVPFAAKVEVLRLEGAAETVKDNTSALEAHDDLSDFGCTGAGRSRHGGFGWLFFFGALLFARRLSRKEG